MNAELNANGIIVGGMIGQRGPQGPQGIQGETGEQGVGISNIELTSTSGLVDTYTITLDDGNTNTFDVTNGTTFTPSVNAEGDLSWSNDGNKENPTTRNIRGPQGIQGEQGPKGDPGAIKFLVVQELPQTGADDTIYLLQEQGETGNTYSEWIYVNNTWEKLGDIPVEIDLTDYVKNTDYATAQKGGVVKLGQYAASRDASGFLNATNYTFVEYQSLTSNFFISKGTLDNVLTATIGDIDSVLDAINGEVI